MAKLNGVKTLDMVNGEITKVEYNGEVYAKVGTSEKGKAVVGDLVLITDNTWVDATKGEFYLCVELSEINPRIIDDVGDYDSNYYDGSYELFRKSTATTDGYRIVTDRDPKAGDFAKLLATDDDDLTVGKYYEILYVDHDGDFGVVDDTGADSYIMESDGDKFEIYEKVSEVGWKKGDKVRSKYSGEIVEVYAYKPTKRTYGEGAGGSFCSHHKGFTFIVGGYERWAHIEDYVLVKPVAKDEPLKVGDYAKVVKLGGHNRKIGDIIKLTVSDGSAIPYEAGLDAFYPDQLVKATDEEVAEASWAAIGRKPNEFKKGDIVRVIENYGNRNVGEIFEINSFVGGYLPTDSEGNVFYIGSAGDTVELITPVEQRFDEGGQSA